MSNENENAEGGERTSTKGLIWAAQKHVLSIFSLSNSEISYQSIKNPENEEDDEDEIDWEEEQDMMGFEDETDLLEEKK